MYNKRAIGINGEKIASAYVKKMGLTILETNYRQKTGEIDIIAAKNNLIAFIEVKIRQTHQYGHPEEAIDRKKKRRMIRTAKYYLVTHNLYDKQVVRFDVLAIQGKESSYDIEYFENAFREER
ncbi:MAG: YraN family protein [Candidatus Cloacimonadota bacterium]|nr:MAG: YraN family protein [Candidatus Cloacimonadota bacterium]